MDLSKLSDAELEAMLGEGAATVKPPAGALDFSKLSDAQLEEILKTGRNPFDQFDPPAEKNPFDQFDPPAKPWERYANETGATLPPWERFPAEKGDAATGPAGVNSSKDPKAPVSSWLENYARFQGLGARTTFGGMAKTALSPGTLLTDAAINAGYGAHKLAAKTGVVSEPNPDAYYGKGGGYLPTTQGVSDAVNDGLDKIVEKFPSLGGYLRAPETPTERMLSAVGEGAVGAMTGVGLGRALATNGTPAARAVGGFMADRPALQMASGAASGAAGQGVQEMGGDGRASLIASILAGSATGAVGARATRPGRAAAPSTADLQAAKSAAYDAVDQAGIAVPGRATQRLASDMRQDLPGEGIFPHLDPRAGSAVAGVERLGAPDAMGNRPPVTLQEIDKVRKNVGRLSGSPEPEVRRTGAIIAEHLDDFVDQIPGAGPLMDNARSANRRYAKASALDNALEKSELRAASTGTGANGENVIRQNLRRFIEDPNSKAFRQFDAPERAAMRDIVTGDRAQNALRYVGKFAPTGPITGYAGAFATSKSLGLVPAAGIAARFVADQRLSGKVDRLGRLVRGGSGAVTRPSAGTRANASRGAVQGFMAGGSATDDAPGRGRYR